MADNTRFKIDIYHVDFGGVVSTVRMRGKRRYLMEKAFLDEVSGHPYPADQAPRPVPDPRGDLYMLDREQMRAYGKFRRKLSRLEREMPARKAQDRLQHGEDAIPPEFQSFCFSLAMGLAHAGETPKKATHFAISTLTREESEAALRYLDRIAAGNHAAAELQRLWGRCIAHVGLASEADPRPFFLAVRAEMSNLVTRR